MASLKRLASMDSPPEMEEDDRERPSETGTLPKQTGLPDKSSHMTSCLSSKSNDRFVNLEGGRHPDEQRIDDEEAPCVPSCVPPAHQGHTELDSLFQSLKREIFRDLKSELERFRKVLCPECSMNLTGGEEVVNSEEEDQMKAITEPFLQIVIHYLRRSKEQQRADCLQSKIGTSLCQDKLKSRLRKKCQYLIEGGAMNANLVPMDKYFTEIFITEGGNGGINREHEMVLMDFDARGFDRPETKIRCEEIFDREIRVVVTRGVAGIGKTALTQKFVLDWAEGKVNQDIKLVFPFTFRELNLLRDKTFSLEKLLHRFFPEVRDVRNLEEQHLLFIFDGLDENRLKLHFDDPTVLTEITASATLDALVTNLIRGHLLPSAKVWITSRPAAANQIPAENVGLVTELRGFDRRQKLEYFTVRFEKEASKIISQIRATRSLYIMCHIPIFCWIITRVLQAEMRQKERNELPKTLTEMYVLFLVVQTKVNLVKFFDGSESDPPWNEENRAMLRSLGKLAFNHLQKGNLIFYDEDLRDCGIDSEIASKCTGVFTQIFKEERQLFKDRVFCFIHLTMQEFLAALYVHMTFIDSNVNMLAPDSSSVGLKEVEDRFAHFYLTAVDKALESPNGHLDLFLRFLLGLSLQSNSYLLRGLARRHPAGSSDVAPRLVRIVKDRFRENLSPERSINLLYCLMELGDHSLQKEVQQLLSSGRLTRNLLPSQWSALAVVLVSSELDVFDLSKYSASEQALQRLLPVVKVSRRVLLDGCGLSPRSCEALSNVLRSSLCGVKELDLSDNDLQDLGAELLSVGLQSPNCTLETLRLSGCLISQIGCAHLADALRSKSSVRELDVSYNYPSEAGEKLLSAVQLDPGSKLEKLCMDHSGAGRLRPGPRKYACDLILDADTAHKMLRLSNNNTKVQVEKEPQPYRNHPDRSSYWYQVLCVNSVSARCYWEVEWTDRTKVGVAYKTAEKGHSARGDLGFNDTSWCLFCDAVRYTAHHNGKRTEIQTLPTTSNRVGVYVDYPHGTVSFYRVEDTHTHLHTFQARFTEPLYPVFGFWFFTPSSVTLCEMDP